MKWNILLRDIGPLFFFSYVGMSLRVILSEFSTSKRTVAFAAGSALNPVILPNTIGCFVMGVIQHPKAKEQLISFFGKNTHTGISTGFAGSLTSLSSWIGYSTSLLFLFYPSAFPPIMEYLWCFVIGWCTSYLSFFFGFHLMEGLYIIIDKFILSDSSDTDDEVKKEENNTFLIIHNIMIISLSIFYIVITIGAILSAILWYEMRMLSIALLSAPFGTFIRYYTSQYNKWIPYFPIMTFAVNVVGCIIFQLLSEIFLSTSRQSQFDLILSENTDSSAIYIPALLLGFCGCLTTVSSFVNETRNLKLFYNYFYGWATFMCTVIPCVLIKTINLET